MLAAIYLGCAFGGYALRYYAEQASKGFDMALGGYLFCGILVMLFLGGGCGLLFRRWFSSLIAIVSAFSLLPNPTLLFSASFGDVILDILLAGPFLLFYLIGMDVLARHGSSVNRLTPLQ